MEDEMEEAGIDCREESFEYLGYVEYLFITIVVLLGLYWIFQG